MSDLASLQLVQQLYDRSTEGKVVWSPSSQERKFAAKIGTYAVLINEVDDPEYPDAPDYELSVVDASGHWIETISNSSLRPFMETSHKGMNPYALLQSLYRSAQRSALGVDRAVQELLDLLKE